MQGLRGVAVLLVVLDHAGVPFLPGGFVGVDVFFVLSGFLITGLLFRRSRRRARVARGFYVRRARRILPAAVLTLVVTDVVASGCSTSSARRRSWSRQPLGRRSSRRTSTSPQRAATTSRRTSRPPPLQHFWSLSVEEQFYLVWPILLVLVVLLGRAGGAVLRSEPALLIVARRRRLARLVDLLDAAVADRRVLLDASRGPGSWRSAPRSRRCDALAADACAPAPVGMARLGLAASPWPRSSSPAARRSRAMPRSCRPSAPSWSSPAAAACSLTARAPLRYVGDRPTRSTCGTGPF